MDNRQRTHTRVWLIIGGLIALAFWMTSSPSLHRLMDTTAFSPHFQTGQRSVCLITVYQGDWAQLTKLCTEASQAGVVLSIAAQPQDLKGHEKAANDLKAQGHCLLLYGLPAQQEGGSARWIERSLEQVQAFRGATSTKTVAYLPFGQQLSADAGRFCSKYNLVYVLFSKDARAFAADSPAAYARVMAQRISEGDMVYVPMDAQLDFAQLGQSLSDKGLIVATVLDALAN